jgi:hypothetical protein
MPEVKSSGIFYDYRYSFLYDDNRRKNSVSAAAFFVSLHSVCNIALTYTVFDQTAVQARICSRNGQPAYTQKGDTHRRRYRYDSIICTYLCCLQSLGDISEQISGDQIDRSVVFSADDDALFCRSL